MNDRPDETAREPGLLEDLLLAADVRGLADFVEVAVGPLRSRADRREILDAVVSSAHHPSASGRPRPSACSLVRSSTVDGGQPTRRASTADSPSTDSCS